MAPAEPRSQETSDAVIDVANVADSGHRNGGGVRCGRPDYEAVMVAGELAPDATVVRLAVKVVDAASVFRRKTRSVCVRRTW